MKRLSSSIAVASIATSSTTAAVSSTPVRSISQATATNSVDSKKNWTHYWRGTGKRASYPSIYADNAGGGIKLGKTHVEWRFHHGTGGRIGRYDATRYVADFEHTDGTPAPISMARHALMHFHDRQLVEMIQSAAVVESLASANRLPRVPGVREQREWDPEIPLFLDDMDEHGSTPRLGTTRNTAAPTGASRTKRDAVQRYIDAKYERAADAMNGKTVIKNVSMEGETLPPITMFANYSPAKMFTEKSGEPARKASPFDRRRWNMSSNFLVYKGPKAKLTIGDGAAKTT